MHPWLGKIRVISISLICHIMISLDRRLASGLRLRICQFCTFYICRVFLVVMCLVWGGVGIKGLDIKLTCRDVILRLWHWFAGSRIAGGKEFSEMVQEYRLQLISFSYSSSICDIKFVELNFWHQKIWSNSRYRPRENPFSAKSINGETKSVSRSRSRLRKWHTTTVESSEE